MLSEHPGHGLRSDRIADRFEGRSFTAAPHAGDGSTSVAGGLLPTALPRRDPFRFFRRNSAFSERRADS
jgi:hypothetical protein